MDYLNRGYSAPCRWRSDSDETTTITWFRAAPDAKVYTLLHAFGSTVWDEASEVASTGPGEVARAWFTWSPSAGNPPAGQSTPTPADEFLHGATPDCAALPFFVGSLAFNPTYREPQVSGFAGHLAINGQWSFLRFSASLALAGSYVVPSTAFAGQVALNAQYRSTANLFAAALALDGEFTAEEPTVFHGARWQNSTTTSVPDNTDTTLMGDWTEDYDTDSYADLTSIAFNIPSGLDGYYLITVRVAVTDATDVFTLGIIIATPLHFEQVFAEADATDFQPIFEVVTVQKLAAGDNVTFLAHHNDGVSLTMAVKEATISLIGT